MKCFLAFASLLFVSNSTCGRIPTFLLLGRNSDIRLVDIEEANVKYNATVLIDQTLFGTGLDSDIRAGLLFYIDSKWRLLVSHVDQPQDAIPLPVLPNELSDTFSVDWITKKLYWAARRSTRIEFISYSFLIDNFHRNQTRLSSNDYTPNGRTVRRTILSKNLEHVTSLRIDPLLGLLFFVNHFSEHQTIERIWLDGSHRQVIYRNRTSFSSIGCLALILERRQIIFNNGSIVYIMDYEGKWPASVLTTLNYQPKSLSFYEDSLYWCDDSRLYSMSLVPEARRGRRILASAINPDALIIFELNKQPLLPVPDIKRTCYNDKECSDACIQLPKSPFKRCVCSNGYMLTSDNKTCSTSLSKVLFFAKHADIGFVTLNNEPELERLDQILPIDSSFINASIAVEYGFLDGGYIYWSDNQAHVIRRAHLNGSNVQTVVIRNVYVCDGLAFDWLANNIYWTDAHLHRIEVARADGSSRMTLISSNAVSLPRAIVVDPIRGFLYWTDWLRVDPAIKKSFLDGSNVKSLLSLVPRMHLPNGLALDVQNNLLYYADAESDEIAVLNLNDRQPTPRLIYKGHKTHIFGLTILEDTLYWSDWIASSVFALNLTQDIESVVLVEKVPHIMGVKAVDLTKPPSGHNLCSLNNGGCSHLCFFVMPRRICACPSNLELDSNNTTCLKRSSFLIYSEKEPASIFKASMNGAFSKSYRLPVQLNAVALNLDFDWEKQRLYWTQLDHSGFGTVFETSLNDSEDAARKFIDIGSSVESLAVDWFSGNIYFSLGFYHCIQVVDSRGLYRRNLIWRDVDPSHLAVDVSLGYLYWSDKECRCIYRADLNGRNIHKTLAVPSNFETTAAHFAIDCDTQRLFYLSDGFLISVDLTTNVSSRLSHFDDTTVLIWTVFKNLFYWTNSTDHSIRFCDMDNSTSCKFGLVAYSGVQKLLALMAVHSDRQKLPKSDQNICDSSNSCDQLCLFSHGISNHEGYCACQSHYTAISGGRCLPPKSFLFFTQNSTVYRTVFPEKDLEVEPPVLIYNIDKVDYEELKIIAMSYDSNHELLLLVFNMVGITDIDHPMPRTYLQSIRFRNGETIQISTIPFSSNTLPLRIVYDAYTASFFWFNLATPTSVNVSKLVQYDPLYVEHYGEIVNNPNMNLLDLAVDGKRGLLYLLHQTSTSAAALVMCSINGNRHFSTKTFTKFPSFSDFQCLTVEDGFPLGVNSLNVDLKTGMVLFLSNYLHATFETVVYVWRFENLEQIRFSGYFSSVTMYNDLLILLQPVIDPLNYVGAIVYYDLDHFEVQTALAIPKMLHAAVITEDSLILPVLEQISIEAAHSPCLKSYCSHFCALTPSRPRFSCYCPVNLTLKHNNRTCEMRASCRKDQFPCFDGRQCIDVKGLCDGEGHCSDQSDESPSICACNFDSSEKNLIFPSLKGFSANRPLPSLDASNSGQDQNSHLFWPTVWPYRCPTRRDRCLPDVRSFCDRHRDCVDGSDESDEICHCASHLRIDCVSLATGKFSRCISHEIWCDGRADCLNSTDESNCDLLFQLAEKPGSNGWEMNMTVMMTISIFGIFLLIFVTFVLGLLSYLRYKNGRDNGNKPKIDSNSSCHVPSTNLNINVHNSTRDSAILNDQRSRLMNLDRMVVDASQCSTSLQIPRTLTTDIELDVYSPSFKHDNSKKIYRYGSILNQNRSLLRNSNRSRVNGTYGRQYSSNKMIIDHSTPFNGNNFNTTFFQRRPFTKFSPNNDYEDNTDDEDDSLNANEMIHPKPPSLASAFLQQQGQNNSNQPLTTTTPLLNIRCRYYSRKSSSKKKRQTKDFRLRRTPPPPYAQPNRLTMAATVCSKQTETDLLSNGERDPPPTSDEEKDHCVDSFQIHQ